MYAEDLCIRVFSLQRGIVKGTVEFTLYPCRILMLCPFFFFVFIWFPNRANVTHESIRDLTMFSMLIFEKKIY